MNTSFDLMDKNKLIDQVGFRKYFTAKNWAEYNRKFFNGLAPKYDTLNQVLTFGLQDRYKTHAVRCSGIQNGDLVLDICTGTGDIAFLIAEIFPRSHVIGVDVAEKMLDIAQMRAKANSSIEFKISDAQALKFEDKMFDAVFMSYGLRNLMDPVQGIKEMKRVVKPGGVINIIDLGKPTGPVKTFLYRAYFENVLPFLGKHIFHRGEFNSFQYLPESNKCFPPPEELKTILENCGLKNIEMFTYMSETVVHFRAYA
ncbi:MAG: ubiquinone/menaquinone biosynthesis methyltransferase [Candidatus Omnitrophota bacterium]